MKKTLVIGASLNPARYSYLAINRLIQNEIPVVAIGLREGEINGVQITKERTAYKDVDTITLYLNPSRQIDFYDYIISLNPKRVIFNPGTENTEFYKILKNNNIEFEAACTLVLLGTNQY